MQEGRNIILPIWLDVDAAYIAGYSPSLADKRAITFCGDYGAIANELLSLLKARLPFEYLSGRSEIRIFDKQGRQSEVRIERTIRVGSHPITETEIQRFTDDGTITSITADHGDILEVRQEGGYRIVRLRFHEPLLPRSVITYRVTMRQRDTFYGTEDSYDATVTPVALYERYEIEVHLHQDNPASGAQAFKRIDGKKVPLGGLEVASDGTRVALRLIRPEVGVSHVLSWQDSITTRRRTYRRKSKG